MGTGWNARPRQHTGSREFIQRGKHRAIYVGDPRDAAPDNLGRIVEPPDRASGTDRVGQPLTVGLKALCATGKP